MKPEIENLHIELLLDYLKSGLSTRQLDKKLGHDPLKSKGWESWAVLKRYKLQKEDRGKLFCFRKHEALIIIKEILQAKNRKEVDRMLVNSDPNFFEKYRDIFIIAPSTSKVATLLSGEVRNITQSFFHPLKKTVGVCQFPKCKLTNLDTVHLRKSRPEHLMTAIEYGHVFNTQKYDAYKILLKYIDLHSKKGSLCFLCKKHHQELSRYEATGGKELTTFRKMINSAF